MNLPELPEGYRWRVKTEDSRNFLEISVILEKKVPSFWYALFGRDRWARVSYDSQSYFRNTQCTVSGFGGRPTTPEKLIEAMAERLWRIHKSTNTTHKRLDGIYGG